VFAKVPFGQLETQNDVEESANSPKEQVHSHRLVLISAKTPGGHC